MAPAVLRRDGLDQLFDAIRRRGFRLVGPVLRDGAICYGDIASASDLPAGWTDDQDAGTYRLRRRDDEALFGYNVGPHSWKKFLFPSSRRWLRIGERCCTHATRRRPRLAFIGVRSCELHAIAIQDRVLAAAGTRPGYAARRERRVHRRGQLRAGRRDLLLRVDGDRAAARRRLTTSR